MKRVKPSATEREPVAGGAAEVSGRKAYSIAEVCEIASLGRTTIYAAIRDGRLVAHKVGRRTLIFPEDLTSFFRNLPRAGV